MSLIRPSVRPSKDPAPCPGPVRAPSLLLLTPAHDCNLMLTLCLVERRSNASSRLAGYCCAADCCMLIRDTGKGGLWDNTNASSSDNRRGRYVGFGTWFCLCASSCSQSAPWHTEPVGTLHFHCTIALSIHLPIVCSNNSLC